MIGRLSILLAAGVLSGASSTGQPLTAYHQHLVSPQTARLLGVPEYSGAALLGDLDRAQTRRGVVLSIAYTYADERKHVPEPDAAVREENDWTAGQIKLSHGRLIGFCSVNPLRKAAMAEVRRCTALPGMHGLKLHFGNSGVSLRDPAQFAMIRRLFSLADARSLPIVVHLHARTGAPYGREDALLFLKLLAATPHIAVQVAHLGGSGAFPADAQAVMQVFATAIGRHDPRVRRVYFDLTSVAMADTDAGDATAIARAVRAVGIERVLFGSDLPVGGNPAFPEAWQLFRDKVPLSEAEFDAIAANRASYLPPG